MNLGFLMPSTLVFKKRELILLRRELFEWEQSLEQYRNRAKESEKEKLQCEGEKELLEEVSTEQYTPY